MPAACGQFSIAPKLCLLGSTHDVTRLRRQSDAAEQVFEPRVGAEGIEHGIDFDENDTWVRAEPAMLVCLLQPIKSTILVSHGGVHLSQIPWQKSLVCRGEMLQLLGLLLHRATVTRNCEGTMDFGRCFRKPIQSKCPFQFVDSFLVHSLFCVTTKELVVEIAVIRVTLKHHQSPRNSTIVLTPVIQSL